MAFKPKIKIAAVDRGFNDLRKSLKKIRNDKLELHVGVLGEGDKNARRGEDLTNVELALIHEYGTARIPERSFIRSTFDKNRASYLAQIRVYAAQVYAGKMTADRALNFVGLRMSADMKMTIKNGIAPPLAASTFRRKAAKSYKGAAAGVPKPLIDTGQLLNSITHAVKPRGSE